MPRHVLVDETVHPCKGTLINVCEPCRSVHITLLGKDMQPIAIANVSFEAWMEMLSETFDEIEAIEGRGEQPAAEGLPN